MLKDLDLRKYPHIFIAPATPTCGRGSIAFLHLSSTSSAWTPLVKDPSSFSVATVGTGSKFSPMIRMDMFSCTKGFLKAGTSGL